MSTRRDVRPLSLIGFWLLGLATGGCIVALLWIGRQVLRWALPLCV